MSKPSTPDSPSPRLTYQQALHRLLLLADGERMAGIAPPLLKIDLARAAEFAERMGHPERSAPVLHVAGTKGKGSVAAMSESMLRHAGLRTMLFTSPHLITFRERLRIDGQPATEAEFAASAERVWPHVEAMERESPEGRPTTFETMTIMAFDLARASRADVQVIEVGMGGRLDSTNVADGRVAVITSLSMDHTAVLGDSIEKIAFEKAGIIKRGAMVVTAPQVPEAMAVVRAKAWEMGARLVEAGRDVTWTAGRHDLTGQAVTVRTPRRAYDLWLPLLGSHQQENAAVAVAAVEAMDMAVTPDSIVAGVREVHWDGRFQVLGARPYVVVDGAHNPYSMGRLREAVREFIAPRRTVLLYGMSSDKDLAHMIAEIAPIADRVIACASRHPRAVPAARLREAFQQAGIAAEAAVDVPSALALARSHAGEHDLVLATGSLFIVGEVLESWFGIPPEHYPELDPASLTARPGTLP
ncbi:MAG: bifunctional folylpolyglutamate synthase/dihydrofolate synthase [SAR202 cluster bacterium]|nr:bifunctional folylpolyglutamate synthase/dihydrofolate synthase [SAR202 cluster bacterium]